jgi:hypothetical protein
MDAQALEVALRDETKGSTGLLPGERMHIIMMMHGKVKPKNGGYHIHTDSSCLRVVYDGKCECGSEVGIEWFEVGCGGLLTSLQIQPITWRWKNFAARQKTANAGLQKPSEVAV